MKNRISKYIIYALLILASIWVRFSTLSCGNVNWDEAINDISIGVLASTLVAAFIEISNDHRLRLKRKKLRIEVLSSFLLSVSEYMYAFCHSSSFLPKENRNLRKTFAEWSEFYCERLVEEDFDFIKNDDFLEYANSINGKVEVIKSSEIWLQSEEIINQRDIDFINKINSIMYQYHIFTIGEKVQGNQISALNKELIDEMSQFDLTESISTCRFGYDFRLDMIVKGNLTKAIE